MIWILYIVFAVSIKDLLFTNQSIGKKVCKIKVIDATTKNVPKKGKLVVRNTILLFAYPLEMLLVLIGSRRLGDLICNTCVIKM